MFEIVFEGNPQTEFCLLSNLKIKKLIPEHETMTEEEETTIGSGIGTVIEIEIGTGIENEIEEIGEIIITILVDLLTGRNIESHQQRSLGETMQDQGNSIRVDDFRCSSS